jgi:chromosome segregation ATPase
MAEAARKIVEPERLLRILEGGKLKGESIQGAALMILDYVQSQVDTTSDLGGLYQILQGLQALLETLPKKLKILDGWQEDKAPVEEKKYRISERLRSIREELREEKPDIVEHEQRIDETSAAVKSLIIDAFAEEQRELILKSNELKDRLKKGENVTTEVGEIEQQIERNKDLWRKEVRKMEDIKKSVTSEEKKALEMRLEETFAKDPEIKALKTEDEKWKEEQKKEQELENWIKSLNPQAQHLVMEVVEAEPIQSKKKKKALYPFRLETGTVVQQAIDTLEEITFRNKYFEQVVRQNMRAHLELILQRKTVPEFLLGSHEVISVCEKNFSELEADHPLYPLGQKIRKLSENLPTVEQVGFSGFSREQVRNVRSEIEQCLQRLVDPEEKVRELQHEIIGKAADPKKSPPKSNVQRALEQINAARNEFQRKKRKGGWRGRNKW